MDEMIFLRRIVELVRNPFTASHHRDLFDEI